MENVTENAVNAADGGKTAMEGFFIETKSGALDSALSVIDQGSDFVLLELTDKKKTVEKEANGKKVRLTMDFIRLTSGSTTGVSNTLCFCKFMPVRYDAAGRPQPIREKISAAGAKVILSAKELREVASGLAKIDQNIQLGVDLRMQKAIVRTSQKGDYRLNMAIPVKSADSVKFLADLSPLSELHAAAELPGSELRRLSAALSAVLFTEKAGVSKEIGKRNNASDRIGLAIGEKVRYCITNGVQQAQGYLKADVSLPLDAGTTADEEGNETRNPAPFIGISAAHIRKLISACGDDGKAVLELRGDGGRVTSLKAVIPETETEYRIPILEYGFRVELADRSVKMSGKEGIKISFDRNEFNTAVTLLMIGKPETERGLRFNFLSETQVSIGEFMNMSVENGCISEKLPENYNSVQIRGRVEGLPEDGTVRTVAFNTGTLRNILSSLNLKTLYDGNGKPDGVEKVVLKVVDGCWIFAMNVPEGAVVGDAVFDAKGAVMKKTAAALAEAQKKELSGSGIEEVSENTEK